MQKDVVLRRSTQSILVMAAKKRSEPDYNRPWEWAHLPQDNIRNLFSNLAVIHVAPIDTTGFHG
jgi:hypothetical protein